MHIRVPFLDLNAHHAPLREEFDRAIGEVIDSGACAGGVFVEKFEAELAAFCRCQHAIGLGSGTEALWLALLACGIGPGDEVITVPNTFMATAEAITYCAARPVFVDVDERTYTMDPAGLEKALSKRTKAIIPVHLFGQPADMDPILEFARKHGLFVIEDAAQAHGAEYKGKRAGTLGRAGCFSFYPGKNLGAYGEAGAVVTDDDALAQRVRRLRDHAQVSRHVHNEIGFNMRMEGVQGAVLGIKLPHLQGWTDARRRMAARYQAAWSGLPGLCVPAELPGACHARHIYALRCEQRPQLQEYLAGLGVQTTVHYPTPLHLQPAYSFLGHRQGDFPSA